MLFPQPFCQHNCALREVRVSRFKSPFHNTTTAGIEAPIHSKWAWRQRFRGLGFVYRTLQRHPCRPRGSWSTELVGTKEHGNEKAETGIGTGSLSTTRLRSLPNTHLLTFSSICLRSIIKSWQSAKSGPTILTPTMSVKYIPVALDDGVLDKFLDFHMHRYYWKFLLEIHYRGTYQSIFPELTRGCINKRVQS